MRVISGVQTYDVDAPLLRFTADTNSRTPRDRFALAHKDDEDRRDLCTVRFLLTVTADVPDLPPLNLKLALVDFFVPSSSDDYPWGDVGVAMGVKVYLSANKVRTVIPIEHLQAPEIVHALKNRAGEACYFAVSCDADGPEPEYWNWDDWVAVDGE
jgi:hypothetical protein